MTFNEALSNRYSCRKFADMPVSRADLTALMEAARVAPSACNSQRWLFIAVDDPEIKKQLADTMLHPEQKINMFAHDVPAFIAMVSHPLRKKTATTAFSLGESGKSWKELDLGIAAAHIMLKATSMGLGSVTIGMYDEKEVQKTLNLPDDMGVPVIIGVGHPATKREVVHSRYLQEELFRFNQY